MLPPRDVLARLAAGNRRFLEGRYEIDVSAERRASLVEGQRPLAAILGCADSRVPAEIVFGQGFGDLFVNRVAGNVATPFQIASIELAVRRMGLRLVVVLGHTRCGAVAAALEGGAAQGGDLGALVAHVRSGIGGATDPREAARQNAKAQARALLDRSAILRTAAAAGELLVVAAEYAIETGEVTVLSELTEPRPATIPPGPQRPPPG